MIGAMAGVAPLADNRMDFYPIFGGYCRRDKWDDYEHDAETVRQLLTNKMVEADQLVKTISDRP